MRTEPLPRGSTSAAIVPVMARARTKLRALRRRPEPPTVVRPDTPMTDASARSLAEVTARQLRRRVELRYVRADGSDAVVWSEWVPEVPGREDMP